MDLLDTIRARVTAELRAQDIYLFGSRARGDSAPDSDFDLLVVTPFPLERPMRRDVARRLREQFAADGLDADIHIRSRSEFEDARAVMNTLWSRAVAEGRRL